MSTVTEARAELSCVDACEALGLSRATYYRATTKTAGDIRKADTTERPKA